jgi:hypothetical protein
MSWFIHREMGWAMRKKKTCPFLKLSDMAENVELQLALWHSDCTVSVIPHQETDRLTETSCLRERPVVPIPFLCKRPALKINSKKCVCDPPAPPLHPPKRKVYSTKIENCKRSHRTQTEGGGEKKNPTSISGCLAMVVHHRRTRCQSPPPEPG